MSTIRRYEKTEDKEIQSYSLWRVWLSLFVMLDNNRTLTTITRLGNGYHCRVRRYERL